MKRFLVVLAFPAILAGSDPTEISDGRYEREQGNSEESESTSPIDYLEIENLDDETLRFVYESWHTNGHVCRVYGSAKRGADSIFGYIESIPEESAPWLTNPQCSLKLYSKDGFIVVEDVHNTCRIIHCGARGHIGSSSFKESSKKPLNGAALPPW